MPDYRTVLSPDPEPRQIARAPGSGPKVEPAIKPASPIAPLPTANQSLAEQLAIANETIGILRSILHGIGASLCSLAGSIGHDVAEAELQARLAADSRRRF